jgi:prepilin-type N-terminal cleavage/methylation domain-containing protein
MIRREPSRRGRDDDDDGGFTLIEVLVATFLFTILTVLIGTVMVLAMRTSNGLEGRLNNATQGQIGIAGTSKMLRAATPPTSLSIVCTGTCSKAAVIEATPTKLSFFANPNSSGDAPSQVTLEANSSGTFVQTMRKLQGTAAAGYSPCTTACVTATRVLSRGLTLPLPAVFTYYGFDGTVLNPAAGGALTADQLVKLTSVDVMLKVQTAANQTRNHPNVSVVRVRLPNAPGQPK